MTDRVLVTYSGSEPVSLHPTGNPDPPGVSSGDVFEIDADVAERLDPELFTIEGPPEELSDEEKLARDEELRPEPVPIDELRRRESEALEVDPDAARGAELDGALEALGQPTGGSLAERQARLEAAQTAQRDGSDVTTDTTEDDVR